MDLTTDLLRRLERVAKRDGLTDTALSLAISAGNGKRNHILMKRLRAGNITLTTARRIEAWLKANERRAA